MSFFLNYRGELAALSADLIWAIASLIYVGLGKQMPPLNCDQPAICHSTGDRAG